MTEQQDSLPGNNSGNVTGTQTSAGFVAVIGAPNAGKSTLVNALVGQKVAIVSAKAQTTRARLMAIAIHGGSQLLLVDTPGIFEPRRRLDRAMVAAAWGGAGDADLILLVVDSAEGLTRETRKIVEGLARREQPLWIALNKVDLVKKGELLALSAELAARLDPEKLFMISAIAGDGVMDLKQELAQAMPEGPWLYPADEVSNATDRMIANELTREQIYQQLHQELPYASAVETESWEDRDDGSTVIHQQILIERDSQKAIVIGKGGSRLKTIGQAAREEISHHLGRKVHLFLHVKVNPRWQEDRSLYREMGLEWAD
jgi:GTP-binding protein Era